MAIPRSSGILLHPTSLPGRFGIGEMGAAANEFVDFLAACGQSWWQILPLSPTGYGNSPYSSFSAFAGNPLLICLERLVEAGDLDVKDIDGISMSEGKVHFGFVHGFKERLLHKAAQRFLTDAEPYRRDLRAFLRRTGVLAQRPRHFPGVASTLSGSILEPMARIAPPA